MKIYIVRHGQTKCNVENKYNCRLDEDINEMGIEQAKQAREKVKKINENKKYRELLNSDLEQFEELKKTARHTRWGYSALDFITTITFLNKINFHLLLCLQLNRVNGHPK